jgi:hypothetical protein
MTRAQALELYTAQYINLDGSYSLSGNASATGPLSASVTLKNGSGSVSLHVPTGLPPGCLSCSPPHINYGNYCYQGPFEGENPGICTPQYWADYTVSPVRYYVHIPLGVGKFDPEVTYDGADYAFAYVVVEIATALKTPTSPVSQGTFTLNLKSSSMTGKLFTTVSYGGEYYNDNGFGAYSWDHAIWLDNCVYTDTPSPDCKEPNPADYYATAAVSGSGSGSSSFIVSAVHQA